MNAGVVNDLLLVNHSKQPSPGTITLPAEGKRSKMTENGPKLEVAQNKVALLRFKNPVEFQNTHLLYFC